MRPPTFDRRRSSGCIEWNGLDGSSSKVGWLQRCLITGLVLYLVRLSEIHQRLRYTATLPTRYRLRGAIGVLPKSRAIRDETMGALAALFEIWSHEWSDRDRHLCALRVACCRWDGRAEWHQEEPVIQCDFSMGYSGAAMHQQHRPAMSQARRLASDEWFGPHHSRRVSRQRTCHQQASYQAAGGRLQSEDFRGRSQRLSYNRCAVQALSSSDHAASCVACAGSHT